MAFDPTVVVHETQLIATADDCLNSGEHIDALFLDFVKRYHMKGFAISIILWNKWTTIAMDKRFSNSSTHAQCHWQSRLIGLFSLMYL